MNLIRSLRRRRSRLSAGLSSRAYQDFEAPKQTRAYRAGNGCSQVFAGGKRRLGKVNAFLDFQHAASVAGGKCLGDGRCTAGGKGAGGFLALGKRAHTGRLCDGKALWQEWAEGCFTTCRGCGP